MKVAAPGKLILSGEHAVVHGAPAIAMAVNRYATTTVTRSHLPRISFDFADVTHQSQLSFKALKSIKHRIKRKYQRFVSGDFSIREVLQKPFELAQFAVGLFTESLNLSLPHGVKVQVASDIPVGCGMGSSAATILSVMHAVSSYLESPISADTLFKLALEAENMQHGFSSGLDLRVAMQGGCIYVNNGNIEKREVPAMTMYLVNSGIPQTSTGECVEAVAAYFKEQHLLNEFANVTNAIDKAIQDNNVPELQQQIRNNHQLLTRIGVVPEKVQRFIADIQNANGAAKICGAGAIKGDRAGAVIVLIDDVTQLEKIAKQYGYTVSVIEADKRGVHAV